MLRAGDAVRFRGGLFFPGAGGAVLGRWLDFGQAFAGPPGAGRAAKGTAA
jgi:hypothetical protein